MDTMRAGDRADPHHVDLDAATGDEMHTIGAFANVEPAHVHLVEPQPRRTRPPACDGTAPCAVVQLGPARNRTDRSQVLAIPSNIRIQRWLPRH